MDVGAIFHLFEKQRRYIFSTVLNSGCSGQLHFIESEHTPLLFNRGATAWEETEHIVEVNKPIIIFMDHNRLQLLGNVTRSPQHVVTNADGSRYVNFSVITGHAFKKGDQDMQDKMEMDIIAWNNMADWCSEHVRMNDRVLVEGRLKQRRVAQGTSICKVYEMVLEKILPHAKSHDALNDQRMTRLTLKKPPMHSADGHNLDNIPE